MGDSPTLMGRPVVYDDRDAMTVRMDMADVERKVMGAGITWSDAGKLLEEMGGVVEGIPESDLKKALSRSYGSISEALGKKD